MILTIVIAVLLLFAFIRGWQRGLFFELVRAFSTVIAFAVAAYFYKDYSSQMIEKLHLDVPRLASNYIFSGAVMTHASQAFYAAFVFLIIFIIVKLVLRFVLFLLRGFKDLLSFGKIGRLIAAILSLAVCYLSIQLLLTMLAILPVTELQNFLKASELARWIITETPVSSGVILKLFIEDLTQIPVKSITNQALALQLPNWQQMIQSLKSEGQNIHQLLNKL